MEVWQRLVTVTLLESAYTEVDIATSKILFNINVNQVQFVKWQHVYHVRFTITLGHIEGG